ncbi:MAG: DedA family protein [Gemmatimonadota bacterium]|jgi:membrane protein DedA with SNARE-associated domain|nr:DedA family protein [Gemmatimonadota bacterium]
MNETTDAFIHWLFSIPHWLLFPMAGASAAIENLFPPFPGDVAVVTVSVIAGATGVNVGLIFLTVWLSNVGTAFLVYAFGRRYGKNFFASRLGSFILAPQQLDRLRDAFRRFGLPVIFFSRFLPVFRPIVPAFAGVAHIPFFRAAIPLALASGVWYGFLVYLGSTAGQNLPAVSATLKHIGNWMWLLAAALIAGVGYWWFRSRQPPSSEHKNQ